MTLKILFAFACVLLLGCSSTKEQVKISGSDTMVILGQAWAEKYQEKYNIPISVTGGGSGVGIVALIDKKIDIAEASRDMKDSEIEQARKNGVEPYKTIVAYDGIAIITHPNNPIEVLTLDQIKDIFRGKITNWKEVGGEDKPISLYSRESSSGTYEFFKEHVLKKADYSSSARYLAGNAIIVESISQDANGIGYVGVAYALQRKDVKILSVKESENSTAYKPTKENVLSKKYSIARSLNFYTNDKPQGEVKKFIDFVLGEEGQKIVEEIGYFRVE